MKGGADHGGSGLHGRTNLRWAENTTHGTFEKQDLSSWVQDLVFDDVLGYVGIFGVSPTSDDDKSRLVFSAGAGA